MSQNDSMGRLARLVVVALALPASATSNAAPSINDAAWLAGRWVGSGLGGTVEETWAPAAGGQMVGHFQLIKNGKPEFYELMLMDVQPKGIRLRVKHFNADFTAWEDRDKWHSFEPVAVKANHLQFRGLAFERSGDRLTITVKIKGKDGTVREFPLRLRRAPL